MADALGFGGDQFSHILKEKKIPKKNCHYLHILAKVVK